MHVSALNPDRRSRLPPLPHCAPPGALGWDLRQVLREPAKGTEIRKGRAGCDWWSPSAPRDEFSPAWHPCPGWSQAWDPNPGGLVGLGALAYDLGSVWISPLQRVSPRGPGGGTRPPSPSLWTGAGFPGKHLLSSQGPLVSAHVGSPPVCPAAPAAPQSRGSGHMVGGHWMFVAKRIN